MGLLAGSTVGFVVDVVFFRGLSVGVRSRGGCAWAKVLWYWRRSSFMATVLDGLVGCMAVAMGTDSLIVGAGLCDTGDIGTGPLRSGIGRG